MKKQNNNLNNEVEVKPNTETKNINKTKKDEINKTDNNVVNNNVKNNDVKNISTETKNTDEKNDIKKEPVKLSKKENFWQIFKFVCFSASAGVIQTVVFALLNELISWPYWPSYLIALVLSVLWNFTLNRNFTFKSCNNVTIAMLEVAGYYLVFTPLSTWWGDALTGIGWNEYLVLAFTMIINLITEYLFTRFVVYRNSINTKQKKNKTTDEKKVVEDKNIKDENNIVENAKVSKNTKDDKIEVADYEIIEKNTEESVVENKRIKKKTKASKN